MVQKMNEQTSMKAEAESLDAIWLVTGGEIIKNQTVDADADGNRFTASRRDVQSLIITAVENDLSNEDIWWDVAENAPSIIAVETHTAPSMKEAIQRAESRCHAKGNILLKNFLNAFRTDINAINYCGAALAFSDSLGLNMHDLYSSYWENAINDGMTPVEAVVSFRDIRRRRGVSANGRR